MADDSMALIARAEKYADGDFLKKPGRYAL